MTAITITPEAISLRVYIQPKASSDKIVGLHQDEIKITITAPPIDGKANAHLIKFLAKQFKTNKQSVIVEKGELGRHKYVRILNAQHIPAEITALLSE